MIDPLKTTAIVNGKTYIVIVKPNNRKLSLGAFVQVYRMRKDGSAGQQLMGHHNAHYAAWQQVRADMLAKCDELGFTA